MSDSDSPSKMTLEVTFPLPIPLELFNLVAGALGTHQGFHFTRAAFPVVESWKMEDD